jgi:F-type H+-transporting ATPase subunit epsilon
MEATLMSLRILLPFEIFLDAPGVSRIVAETPEGSFGLLPHRLDCVGVLEPGILTYQSGSKDESFVAVDQGVLVKTGLQVLVSVRRAVTGSGLSQLRELVEKEFLTLDDDQKSVRTVMAKLEIGLLRRLAGISS